jgi:Sulfatase-modifying factor enzyme 1
MSHLSRVYKKLALTFSVFLVFGLGVNSLTWADFEAEDLEACPNEIVFEIFSKMDFELLWQQRLIAKRYYDIVIAVIKAKARKIEEILQEDGWVNLPQDEEITAFLDQVKLSSTEAKSPLLPLESKRMIGAKGVKQALWVEVMDNNPSQFQGAEYYFQDEEYKKKRGHYMKPHSVKTVITKDGERKIEYNPDLPVEMVSWASSNQKDSEQEFLSRMNFIFRKAGRPDHFSRPLEHHWEWAARGGTVTRYVTGDNDIDAAGARDRLAKYATWYNNSHQDLSGKALSSKEHQTHPHQTHPVDERDPNAFGFIEVACGKVSIVHRARTAWSVAAVGAAMRGSSIPRTVTSTTPIFATTIWAFAS